MNVTKIAMAALIASTSMIPSLATAQTSKTHRNTRPVAMYDSQKAFESALKSIPVSQIDVQPAAPAPGTIALAGSKDGAAVLFASFPTTRTVNGPRTAHVVQVNYTHGDF